MFKELKLIKLIVFVGLLVAIISKIDFSDNIITGLYIDKFSYYPDENVEIYASTNSFFSLTRNISITAISGKKESSFDIELRQQSTNKKSLEEGFKYDEHIDYKFSKGVKSGIYLVENRYPIIIKSKQQAEITVVYPYANNILYQAHLGRNVFALKTKKASLNRTSPIGKYTEGLKPFFNYLNNNYNVNYISDLDLEDIDTYKGSKLLVLYGKLTCWTPKMKESLNTYLFDNGNVLLMSSYVLNNVCWYNGNENHIIMYDDVSNKMKSWRTYNGNQPEKSIGISYANGGYSNDSIYQLVNDGHPILKGVTDEFISINADLYSSPPIKWYDDIPRIDLDSLGFYKGDIIAYGEATYQEKQRGIKGIFVLQPDSTSGKIVSLGTGGWCLKENYQRNKSVQLITQNSIKYLLK